MQAVRGRAAILVASGQLDAAEPLVERLIEAREFTAEAYVLQGRILLARSQLDEAIAAFTRAADEDASSAEAYGYRAEAKQRQRDYPAALVDYNQAIELNPRLAFARAGRCWTHVLLETEDMDEAREDARASAEFDPAYVPGQLCKGLLHLRAGEWADARAAYEAALAIEPGNPVALFGRGIARRRSGDRDGSDDMNQARDFDDRIGGTFDDWGVRTY